MRYLCELGEELVHDHAATTEANDDGRPGDVGAGATVPTQNTRNRHGRKVRGKLMICASGSL